EELADLAIGPMRGMMMLTMRVRPLGMLAVHTHVEFRGDDPRTLGPFARDVDGVQAEPRERIPHGVERYARVEQRPDGHVAADSGKCIEKSDPHDQLGVAGPGGWWYTGRLTQ